MSAPAPTAGPRPDRTPHLDGVRGVAILLVMGLHLLHRTYNPAAHPGHWFTPVHYVLGGGWVGVDLFFALSGFLLGGILLDHAGAPNLRRVFYLRRACRILPVYLLFLSPFLVVPLFHLADRFPPLQALLSTGGLPLWGFPLFLQNILMTSLDRWGDAWISPTWSLAVEEQFYLVLPFVLVALPRRRLPHVLAAVAAGSLLLRVGLHFTLAPDRAALAAYTLLPCRADALALGVLGAWAVRDATARAWLGGHARPLRRAWAAVAAAAGALLLWSPELTSVPMYTAGFSLFAVVFAGWIVGLHLGLAGHRWLEAGWLRGVGRLSYSLYLLHTPVVAVVFQLGAHHARRLDTLQDVALMAAGLALTFALAALSWVLLERPILALGRRALYAPPPPDKI